MERVLRCSFFVTVSALKGIWLMMMHEHMYYYNQIIFQGSDWKVSSTNQLLMISQDLGSLF